MLNLELVSSMRRLKNMPTLCFRFLHEFIKSLHLNFRSQTRSLHHTSSSLLDEEVDRSSIVPDEAADVDSAWWTVPYPVANDIINEADRKMFGG